MYIFQVIDGFSWGFILIKKSVKMFGCNVLKISERQRHKIRHFLATKTKWEYSKKRLRKYINLGLFEVLKYFIFNGNIMVTKDKMLIKHITNTKDLGDKEGIVYTKSALQII